MNTQKPEVQGDTLPFESKFKLSTCIFNYIRRKNKKTGLLIACKFKDTDGVFLGWSLAHKDDKFDIKKAFDIAMLRAYTNYLTDDELLPNPSLEGLPSSINKDLEKFLNRVNKYFFKPVNQQNFIYINNDIDLVSISEMFCDFMKIFGNIKKI